MSSRCRHATGDPYPSDMSLSQPSRTIVVEPVQVPAAAPAPAEEPPAEPPRRVEPAPRTEAAARA
jgi:hypothetical protein